MPMPVPWIPGIAAWCILTVIIFPRALSDPLLLDNMREGAALLVKHISQKNKVFIQIDEDCDGYTSAAVLINYLNLVAPYFVQNYLVYKTHDKKEHGVVVDLVPPDTKLVIIPDAGSSQLLEHS